MLRALQRLRQQCQAISLLRPLASPGGKQHARVDDRKARTPIDLVLSRESGAVLAKSIRDDEGGALKSVPHLTLHHLALGRHVA